SAYGICADQFRLLAPHPSRAHKHPGRPDAAGDSAVVTVTADDGSIPLRRNRNRLTLQCAAYGTRADQFRLLAPNSSRPPEHPSGPWDTTETTGPVIERPPDDCRIPIAGE